MKTARNLFIAISFIPAIWYVLFLIYLLLIYNHLGSWPQHSFPEPEELGLQAFHKVLLISGIVVFLSFAFWMFLFSFLEKNKIETPGFAFFIFLIFYALFILYPVIDPWDMNPFFSDENDWFINGDDL